MTTKPSKWINDYRGSNIVSNVDAVIAYLDEQHAAGQGEDARTVLAPDEAAWADWRDRSAPVSRVEGAAEAKPDEITGYCSRHNKLEPCVYCIGETANETVGCPGKPQDPPPAPMNPRIRAVVDAWQELTPAETVTVWYEVDAMTHGDTVAHFRSKLTAAQSALEQANAKWESSESALEQVIKQRDEYGELLNELVGNVGGVEKVGEHSNLNDPYRNAVDATEDVLAQLEQANARVVEVEKEREYWKEQTERWQKSSNRNHDDCIKAESALAEANARAEKLERLLRNDEAWPLRDVLARLADFAHERLTTHSYDGHGWEELQRAKDTARAILADWERPPAPVAAPPPLLPDVEETDEPAPDMPAERVGRRGD